MLWGEIIFFCKHNEILSKNVYAKNILVRKHMRVTVNMYVQMERRIKNDDRADVLFVHACTFPLIYLHTILLFFLEECTCAGTCRHYVHHCFWIERHRHYHHHQTINTAEAVIKTTRIFYLQLKQPNEFLRAIYYTPLMKSWRYTLAAA